jgi:hypothetical protein
MRFNACFANQRGESRDPESRSRSVPCMTVHMVNVGGAGFIVKLPNDKIMVLMR